MAGGRRKKTKELLITPRGVDKFPYKDLQGTSQDMTRTPESSDQIQSTRPVASAPNPPHTGTAISCPGLQSGLDAQQGILSSSHVPLATRVTHSTAAGPTASAFSAHEQQHPRSLSSEARFATPDSFGEHRYDSGQERSSQRQVPVSGFPKPPPHNSLFGDYNTFAHQRQVSRRVDPTGLIKQATKIAT